MLVLPLTQNSGKYSNVYFLGAHWDPGVGAGDWGYEYIMREVEIYRYSYSPWLSHHLCKIMDISDNIFEKGPKWSLGLVPGP